jgi:hypothetical protein
MKQARNVIRKQRLDVDDYPRAPFQHPDGLVEDGEQSPEILLPIVRIGTALIVQAKVVRRRGEY